MLPTPEAIRIWINRAVNDRFIQCHLLVEYFFGGISHGKRIGKVTHFYNHIM